jgi:hypothetical protein
LEPPEAYAKGVVALVVLTELLRLFDLATNWTYLATAPGYSVFFHGDLFFVFAGIALVVSIASGPELVLLGGLTYSLGGFLITFVDPDFPFFLGNPIYWIGTELSASLLYTVGLLVLVLMLVVASRGMISLRMSGRIDLSWTLRTLAASSILGSGVAHLYLGFSITGLGRLTLSMFGFLYLVTAAMLWRKNYAFGIVIPVAGLLAGLSLPLSSANMAFIAVEIFVIGTSASLGYKSAPELHSEEPPGRTGFS